MATTHRSLAEALRAARGVTSFVSEIAPTLLLGSSFLPDERASIQNEIGISGFAPGACGKCAVVALGSAKSHRQGLLTIDARDVVIRRFQWTGTFRDDSRNGGIDRAVVDDLAIYETEFDSQDELRLTRELDLQPW